MEDQNREKEIFMSNYKNVKDTEFIKNTLGETYEEKSELQKEIIVDFFTKTVTPHVKLGFRVLDLGCGTGNTTQKFLPLVGESGFVLGTDISEGMIKKAKEKEKENLKFGEADALTFSKVKCVSEEEDFDLIFSSHMLHWVEDKKTVFQQIKNRLKSGGQFIGTFAIVMSEDGPQGEIIDECADEILKEETEHIAVFMPTPSKVKSDLEEAGLEVEHLNFFIPMVEFKGKGEEGVIQRLSSHYETIITIAADKPQKRKELLNYIAKRTFDTAKDPNHRWSKIIVEGQPVNYFMVEERENDETVLLMRCEIIEFVARKK